jgi:hypothetical protein
MSLPESSVASVNRDTVFVSHANPEDNTFALWLTLRLGEMGFKVWCDLTKLIGGETFWDKAEDAIRNSTAKFVYVLSRTSNRKDGVLRELQLAQALAKSQSLENFVVPLRIDDLRFEDTTIELQRLLSIQCHPSWEAGLAQLLRRLETDAVPRSSLSGPSAIAAWWTAHRSAEEGVLHKPDEHLSNHFPVTSWPTDLLVHQLHRDSVGKIEIPGDIIVPCSQDGGALLSFVSADELTPHLGPILSIRQSRAIPCAGWHEQGCPAQFGPHIVRILKMAWLNFVRQKGLPLHEMANHVQTLFFKADTAQNDTVGYDWGEGRRSNRQVVGYKTITNFRTGVQTRRHWHFGIDARPFTYPKVLFMVKSHVLFSDDGRTIWDDDKKLLAARAGQCKNWWNPAWRDRLLGTMAWLANGVESITLSLGGANAIDVSTKPTTHVSPVSYRDPGEAAWSDEDDVTEDDGEDTETETDE